MPEMPSRCDLKKSLVEAYIILDLTRAESGALQVGGTKERGFIILDLSRAAML